MSPAALVAYGLALTLAVATPGPAMVALIARSVARGSRSGLGMALGIALADVILGTLALLGLAAVIASYGWVLTSLRYAAAFYLVWLGVRMWRSLPDRADERPRHGGDLTAGLAVGLSNPKAMLFHASLMPLLLDLRQLDWPSAAAIPAIIFAANLSVMSAYACAAGAGGGRMRSAPRFNWMNRLAGGMMVGLGVAVAAR